MKVFAVFVMSYGDFYEIIDLKTKKNNFRRLFQSHSGRLEPSATRLIDVMTTAGCRSVVVEKEYVDTDFRDSHKSFHYLHYKDTARRCVRLHFFSSAVTLDDVRLMPETIAGTYLGYTVIRPLPSHPFGSTILSESVLERMFQRIYPNEDRYLGCWSPQRINLAGNQIDFRGVPWMQQDKLVAACASIAIWIANRHLAEKFPHDFKRSTSAQITKMATHYNPSTGRGMPSDGLTAEQMVKALTSLGYEPLFLESQSSVDATQICTEYVRSSIPVIAIIDYPEGGHAVTIVGHTLKSNPINARQATSIGGREVTLHNLSDFVPRFIVQDDSGGPLRFMEFISWEEAEAKKYVPESERPERDYKSVVRLTPSTNGKEEIAYLACLLVPLPLRVTLKAKQAHRNALQVVKYEMIEADGLNAKELIVDTFLRSSSNYKTWWSPLEARPLEVAPLVRSQMLPHSVWISEVSTRESDGKPGKVLGHIVQDSSGRGTEHHLDDLIIFIGTQRVAFAGTNGTFLTSPRSSTTPICSFREGENI